VNGLKLQSGAHIPFPFFGGVTAYKA